ITDLLQDKPRLTARFDLLKQNPRLAVSMPHLLSESLLVCHGVARAAMSVAETSPRPANRCSGVRTGRRGKTWPGTSRAGFGSLDRDQLRGPRGRSSGGS